MAAKYRKVDPRIWTDERFRKLKSDERLLALWLLTNTRLNRCGIVLWSAGLASEETGISLNKIDTVCDTVCMTLNWVRDTVSKTVFFPKWWRYNAPDNSKALIGALSDLHDIPENHLKPHLVKACEHLKPSLHTVYRQRLDTVSDTVAPQEQEQEQEQKQYQEQECVGDTHTKKRFIIPTLEEVSAYCRERGNRVDANRFVDFYASKGWKIGQNSMKDWKAAVRTWEKNEHNRKPTSPVEKTAEGLKAFLERHGEA